MSIRLVLRHENQILRQSNPKPKLDWTDRLLLTGLIRKLPTHIRHDNRWQPHRSLDLQPPRSEQPVADLNLERIKRRSVLEGLIHEYERTT
jgi:putative transposase